HLLAPRLQVVAANSFASTAGVVLAAAGLIGAAARVQAVREATYPPPPLDAEVLYVRSGPMMKRIAGAYAPIAADIYWVRAIQYYGGTKLRLMHPDPA